MSTTSTIDPGLGDNWSSFGAIVFVSILGPVLTLLFTVGPLVLLASAPGIFEVAFCLYVGSCENLGSEYRFAWAFKDYSILYISWAVMGAGFACVVTLELAFHAIRRAALTLVVIWHASLIIVLSLWLPFDWLRSFISYGSTGTALVSMHYYLSYSSLRLFQLPEPAVGDTQRASNVSQENYDSVEFSSGLVPSQRWAQLIEALVTAAYFGLAFYGFVKSKPVLLVGFVGLGVYTGLVLLHRVLSSRTDRVVTVGQAGLSYLGQGLSWAEIGRVSAGTGRLRHIVVIETSERAANRVLQATTWINRLFAKADVVRGKAGTVRHSVVIDMRFLMGEAAELVQAIEAHRPPGSRWMPKAEVS